MIVTFELPVAKKLELFHSASFIELSLEGDRKRLAEKIHHIFDGYRFSTEFSMGIGANVKSPLTYAGIFYWDMGATMPTLTVPIIDCINVTGHSYRSFIIEVEYVKAFNCIVQNRIHMVQAVRGHILSTPDNLLTVIRNAKEQLSPLIIEVKSDLRKEVL